MMYLFTLKSGGFIQRANFTAHKIYVPLFYLKRQQPNENNLLFRKLKIVVSMFLFCMNYESLNCEWILHTRRRFFSLALCLW